MKSTKTTTLALACTFAMCLPAIVVGPHAAAQAPPQSTPARKIVADTGVDRGLCAILGCGDGALAVALHKEAGLIVHALDPDARAVGKARENIGNLYGADLSVEQSPMEKLPYADNLVNLIVVPDAALKKLSLKEIIRVLQPGGSAYIGAKSQGELKKILADIENVKFTTGNGVWAWFTKPRPEGMDDWSHVAHAADNHRFSNDRFAGPPFATQWISEPKIYTVAGTTGGTLGHVYSGRPITANGRLFFLNLIDRNRRQLIALDAFNGTRLWAIEVAGGVRTGSMVATKDVLFSTLTGKDCQVIDAKTGKVKAVYILDGAEGAGWDYLAHYRGVLYGEIRETAFALDGQSGKLLWQRKGLNPICIGDGRMYACRQKDELVALDARSGKETWRKTDARFSHGRRGLGGFFHAGALYVFSGRRPIKITAVSAKDGAIVWTGEGHPKGFDSYVVMGTLLCRDTRWMHITCYDVETGKEKADVDLGRGASRCTKLSGVGDWLLYCGGIGAVNVKTREKWMSDAGRTSCQTSLISGNGLTYAMPNDCFCGNSTKGVISLAKAPDTIPPKGEEGLAERFEKGPAWSPDHVKARAEDGDNWSTFRHDSAHSAVTSAKVDLPLSPLWTGKVKGLPTPLAVADGLVFVGTDDNRVYCLEADTGKLRWTYITGGAVTITPTVYEDLVLFGCRDGRVTCLEANTGKLVWRFRAAPLRRRIMMYEHLSSTWPVGGGVLVVNDVAYFYAGRAAHDGAYLYAVEPRSGKIIWQNGDLGFTRDEKAGVSPDGAMVSDGKRLLVPTGFSQPVGLDINGGKLIWKTRGGTSHNSFYNKRGGDRLMLNRDLLIARQDDPAGWKRGGRYYIYEAATGKGMYSGIESVPWKRPRDKTWQYMMLRAAYGAMVFWNDELYTTECKASGTTINGITAARTPKGGTWKVSLTLKVRWSVDSPMQASSAIVAGETYFCAGGKVDDPKKGLLVAISRKDGNELGKWPVAGVPVKDGMAAADGHLYVATRDGKIICFGRQK